MAAPTSGPDNHLDGTTNGRNHGDNSDIATDNHDATTASACPDPISTTLPNTLTADAPPAGTGTHTTTTSDTHLLSLSLAELDALLDANADNGSTATSSRELARACLRQIERHSRRGPLHLNAVISTVDEGVLMRRAGESDARRRQRGSGGKRGPLDGIPFVVKDSIWTDASWGVPTTCGTVALESCLARGNADVVQSLLDAGMILIGKTNLSELGGAKGDGCKGGWSALGGQTQSAYVAGGVDPTDTYLGHSTPAGSSSGSAVAVSALMAPCALGTEADGSLMIPADRAALYALKPSVGCLSTKGCLPFAEVSDCPGPMAKTPWDVGLLMNALVGGGGGGGHGERGKGNGGQDEDDDDEQGAWKGKRKIDFTRFLVGASFAGLRVGFLDPEEWAAGTGAVRRDERYDAQVLEAFNDAIDKIEKAGAIVHRKVELRRFEPYDLELLESLTARDYNRGFESFTSGLINPPVRSLAQLVDWNRANAERALPSESPSQSVLEQVAFKSIPDHIYMSNYFRLLGRSRDAVDRALHLLPSPPTPTPPRNDSRDQTTEEQHQKQQQQDYDDNYDLDVLLTPPTGRSVTLFDTAGYPVGSLPLGLATESSSRRPFGMCVVARDGREDLVLRVMGAWEGVFGGGGRGRLPPSLGVA